MWTLVTGGAKRIGRAVCEKLASEGYNIIIHYNESLNEAKETLNLVKEKGVQAEIIQGNFLSHEGIKAFIMEYSERFSRTQNIVHNVGNYYESSLLNTSEAIWQELWMTNLEAPRMITQALMPCIERESGAVVTFGVAGLKSQRANKITPAYAIIKQALYAYTKALALECAPKGVRANMVSPGFCDVSQTLPDIKKIPMNRFASVQEIAEAVFYFINKNNKYITGQNLEVSGGFNL